MIHRRYLGKYICYLTCSTFTKTLSKWEIENKAAIQRWAENTNLF